MTLEETKKLLFADVNAVYEVFKSFFGEDKVDLQGLPSDEHLSDIVERYKTNEKRSELTGQDIERLKGDFDNPFILVYWPSVTVTNENNSSIIIEELYAKIKIDMKGNIPLSEKGFSLNRAKYSKQQFLSGYMHSHVCSIPTHDFTEFQYPCMGRGPINHTIVSLKTDNDEVTWMLFCQELDMYVRVESLHGIPYHYLERVTSGTDNTVPLQSCIYERRIIEDTTIPKEKILSFIQYYLQKGNLNFGFREGGYTINRPMHDLWLDMSNVFIEWYNSGHYPDVSTSVLLDRGILIKATLENGKWAALTSDNSRSRDLNSMIGKEVCTFKEKTITLDIVSDFENGPERPVLLLNYSTVCFVYTFILSIINSYGNLIQDTNEHTSTPRRKICYI